MELNIPEYRRPGGGRRSDDVAMALAALARGLPALALLVIWAIAARAPAAVVVLGPIVGWVAVSAAVHWFAELSSRGVLSFFQPSGRSTPYQPTYSKEEALAAAGDVDGALAAYDRAIAASPLDAEARIAAAELCARSGRPGRAVELLADARRVQGVSPARELYATSRMIDLFAGPLGDRGRAIVELRRLAERHAGTREAEHARAAIARLKAELFADAD